MRKIIFSCLFLTLLFLSPSAYAQNASPSASVPPTGTVSNVLLTKALNNLVIRFRAGLSRTEKIASRIATRLPKIYARQPTSVSTRQNDLVLALGQMEKDLTQLDLASKNLASSSSPKKDFPAFKNQALALTKKLNDAYALELNLVSDMKQIASGSVGASLSATPAR